MLTFLAGKLQVRSWPVPTEVLLLHSISSVPYWALQVYSFRALNALFCTQSCPSRDPVGIHNCSLPVCTPRFPKENQSSWGKEGHVASQHIPGIWPGDTLYLLVRSRNFSQIPWFRYILWPCEAPPWSLWKKTILERLVSPYCLCSECMFL